MKKIKIAQIGVGHDHATFIFDSILRLQNIFEMKGFCVCEQEEQAYEPHKDTIYACAPKCSLEDILNDPELDAVVIETREALLVKYAGLAIEHGLHVHMDKPGCADPAEFDDLMLRAKEKRLTMSLGYMYRYNPVILKAIEAVDKGELGEIYSVEAHMDCLHTVDKRKWLAELPGGMMYFLGCHLIDLIVRIQGVPETIIPMNTCTGFDDVSCLDFGMAAIKYPKGISFAKACATEPGGFMRRQLVICGEKGTLEINPFERYVASLYDEFSIVTGYRFTSKKDAEKYGWNHRAEYRETEAFNRYDSMMEAFAAMVRGEKENPYTYEYEMQMHKIMLCACGLKERKFIKV